MYIHVEKVGGITLGKMFHQLIDGFITPAPDYGPYFSADHLAKAKKWYPTKINGIGGHRIDPQDHYFDDQYQFSMVREPISRLISHYNWQKTKMGIDRSFEKFVDDPYFQNFQTFRLTGERTYDKAVAVIDSKYDLIGIMKYYSASIGILSEALTGDNRAFAFEKSNVTATVDREVRLDLLDASMVAHVHAQNMVDIRIYEFLKARFEKLYAGRLIAIDNQNGKSSTTSRILQKISNKYLSWAIQPMIQDKAKYGY